jgi:protoheme IX farnesyltransferase
MSTVSAKVNMASVADYITLLKPRVMSLVVFTAFVGMMMAPDDIHPITVFAALLCIAAGAGAAGALNMWYDADIDAAMVRTVRRPVPAGKITPGEALTFGLALSVGSVGIFGLVANWLAAALLAFTIFFYIVIYTMWLKRSTPQSIVIGGAAGAFPPMIGWAAATGDVGPEALILFLIIFFWTPPHFWALSLYRLEDFARAGVPVLPVVSGVIETRRQIFFYTLILAPIGAMPWVLGHAGAVYGFVSLVGGALMLVLALRVKTLTEGAAAEQAARHLFAFSILYLFLIFAVLLVEGNPMGTMSRRAA